MSKKYCLITGAAGFVGSNLSKNLSSSGANVVGLIQSKKKESLLFYEKIDKKINDLIENQNRLPNKFELISFCKSVIKGELNVENSILLSDIINQFILENETNNNNFLFIFSLFRKNDVA